MAANYVPANLTGVEHLRQAVVGGISKCGGTAQYRRGEELRTDGWDRSWRLSDRIENR